MYTIRNLIIDAYTESGVVGMGMTVSDRQLQEGLSSLNLILDEIYAGNEAQATIAAPVTLTGASNYTVGPAPADPILTPELVPDLELPLMPNRIDSITITVGGSRIVTRPVDPTVYNSRSLTEISNQAPNSFYLERTFPLGTVRFLDGTPTGPAEIVYKPNMVDVGANTDFAYYPREIRPYLVYATATRLAENNTFDASSLKARANRAWNKYKASAYQGQHYNADASAPGGHRGGTYNIYAGD